MASTSDERRRQDLLEWLFDQGTGRQHVNSFHESTGSTPHEAFEDLEYLKREGRARVEHQGGGLNYAEISSDGCIAVEQLRERRADVPSPNRACRREMLRWLYRVGARGESGHRPTWPEFVADTASSYLGSAFAPGEIEENAA